MSKVVISNAATGEVVEREMTVDEQAKRDAENAEWQAEQQARAQAEVDAQRHAAYTAESDPLFFKWQRGSGTEQAWLDKIAEIQARYPDPA